MIIGIGPMNIRAPKFAEPSPYSIAAKIKIIMPVRIRKKPRMNNIRNFRDSSGLSSKNLAVLLMFGIGLSYPEVMYEIIINIMRAIVSASERSKIALIDFLSVPKIIGIGPINIAPAPFIFPSHLTLKMKSRRIATNMITIPAKIKAMPKP